MDHSPPKRMTRARAAIKSCDNPVKTCRVAASTCKAGNTSTKRKTRSDEVQGDDHQQAMEKATAPELNTSRGRTKKTIGSTLENSSVLSTKKPTRGRPRKVPINLAVPELATNTRRRAKKTNDVDDEKKIDAENIIKRTRRRPISTLKSVEPTKAAKIEELDKENIVPDSRKTRGITKKQAELSTGFRAKPVRKPPTTRTTRARKPVDKPVSKPTPLSPKKLTQVVISKKNSDESLATAAKPEIEPLKQSSLKASGTTFSTAINNEFSSLTTNFNCDKSKSLELKDSILSPARRPPHNPLKDGMKTAALKIHNNTSILLVPPKSSMSASTSADIYLAEKPALLQSPARRPRSPSKIPANESPSKIVKIDMPNLTLKSSNQSTLTHPSPKVSTSDIEKADHEIPLDPETNLTRCPHTVEMNVDNTSMDDSNPEFSGRLSSIMPRDLDPTIISIPSPRKASIELHQEYKLASDHMDIDSMTARVNGNNKNSSLSQNSSDPFLFKTTSVNITNNSEPGENLSGPSQDSSNQEDVAFPTSSGPPLIQSPKFLVDSQSKQYEMNGFTPLAEKLSHWMVENPENSEVNIYSLQISPTASDLSSKNNNDDGKACILSQSKSFDDESMISEKKFLDSSVELDLLVHDFEPIKTDQQDLELAMEANELSLIGPSVTDILGQEALEFEPSSFLAENYKVSPENSPIQASKVKRNLRSTASLKYSIDPQLLALSAQQNASLTPKRVFTEKYCHTVCKVPLKPAADETPIRPSLPKRSASISRPPAYSSSFHSNKVSFLLDTGEPRSRRKRAAAQVIPVPNDIMTPLKQHAEWSNLVTPERAARSDLDPCLLKGAVILVDVYTSDGVDSSAIFTEILTQMGAQCVKSWSCDENTEEGKLEITHVVFKDGRESILDKVRESAGRVRCIGLGWVLDCERDNIWLDEAPYLVETDFIPPSNTCRRTANCKNTTDSISTLRQRRRHQNEHKNLPSTIQELPTASESHRRDSSEWVRPPIPAEIQDLSQLPPLPTTPCPEGFAGYDGDQTYHETPSETPYFLHRECLLQKTAPVKRHMHPEQTRLDTYHEQHHGPGGVPTGDRNEGIMLRLLAAKRKSLQWAPKVGSPLAKSLYF
ncbi:hypothetical protein K3495_g1052 [Podosphaera aphanis]|nr:hypothetical protein K3495_g1052 [Podosphaera aphanis]